MCSVIIPHCLYIVRVVHAKIVVQNSDYNKCKQENHETVMLFSLL